MTFHESVINLSNHYFDTVADLLQRDTLDPEAIHDIRVLMKRLRGLLRLYAVAGQRAEADQLNPVLRDTAKAFAGQRDAHVLADTLSQCALNASKSVAARLLAIRDDLQRDAAAVEAQPDVTALRQALVRTQEQWNAWFADQDDQRLLGALARHYRRNRRQGREALRLRDQEVLHDWRKRVKYLHYQLCALPDASLHHDDLLQRTRKLGSLLGKVHDLDVLVDYLQQQHLDDPGIHRLLAKRRTRLVKKIRRLYRRIFQRPTREFRNRIAAP